MTGIEIYKVTTEKNMNDFISLPRHIYKGCDQYVPDMDMDIRDFFSPKKNPSLRFADVQPFIAYRDNEPVGRITGIISYKSNEIWSKKIVRFSHIEFVDDPEVSKALINAVEQWGKERGMEEIQGPMGITDYDKEGMLIEDFELDGSIIEIWNHPYYPKHMEQMGFVKDADWLQIRIDVPKEVPARYARVAAYSREEFKLKVVKKTKKEIYGSYGKKIFDLLNACYAPLFGFAPFSDEQAYDFIHKYVPLLDLDFVTFIENDKEELVCIAITMADISDGLKKSKGKLFPFGWYHLLKSLKMTKHDKAELMIIGVHPEYQGLGVNALIFDNLIPIYNRKGIKWCETGPQLDNNVKELSQWKVLKPEMVKRRRCWVKNITA